MEKALRRPQSLPTHFMERKASFVDMPDLHEEIYNHPEDEVYQQHQKKESKSKRSNSMQEKHQYQPMIMKRNSSTESSTLPLPIPIRPQSKEAEREEELHKELTHVYNNATWKMYHRIQNARRAKYYINERDRKLQLSEAA